VSLRERVGIDFATAVIGAIPDGPPCVPSNAYGAPFELTYDSGHVLPFIADSLAVSPREARIAYIGANPVLERMLTTVVAEVGLGPLVVPELDNQKSLGRIIRNADVFIVDFGLDVSLVDTPLDPTVRSAPAPIRRKLDPIFAALKLIVSSERARLKRGEHPRRVVLVNSTSGFWNEYVLGQLDCSYTTIHSRVRRATVRPLPDEEAATRLPMMLSPMEGAVVEIYRRRPIFKTIINSLIRVGAGLTRAARLGRPPNRLAGEAPQGGQTNVGDGPSPGLSVTREPRGRVRDTQR
jgi:hypothetical protein